MNCDDLFDEPWPLSPKSTVALDLDVYEDFRRSLVDVENEATPSNQKGSTYRDPNEYLAVPSTSKQSTIGLTYKIHTTRHPSISTELAAGTTARGNGASSH
ncbi:hypothetical protein JTE90_025947 [Oedothorax gibbosus]|uniref:Uncharacterized protein n=1 Tax=Oedothorax gibbosus TaxID=931172 RepID=A0AAV6TQS2_9ARAC|nr:hypothetical protein JTE90_025947 [Oedothorax gibbosus]